MNFSTKDLKTLSEINSNPETWALTPIKWVEETRVMRVKEDCKACHGNGRTNVNHKTGKPAKDATYENINDRKGWCLENSYQECPVCLPSRGRKAGYAATGLVWVEKPVKVKVGYPQWKPTTNFYTTRYSGCDCQLCGKAIKWYRVVPVHGQDTEGNWHGLWVGLDCAKKFPLTDKDELKGVGDKKIFAKEKI